MIQPFDTPIPVTRPFLPPLDCFCDRLHEIWESRWLTNNGPIVQRFAESLACITDTENLCLFNNGTLALQIGLQGLGVQGEVITTPFTFVATTHALHWNNIRPVFVDIEPDYYTLDPERVDAAITPWTTAILAVHVYGHPCRLAELSEIAERRNLLLIYDAAHSFGVRVGGRSIAGYGDLSMFSFHATKLFHSLEGGMLVFPDADLQESLDYLKNFGFRSETEVALVGTNAKMNEMQALMGETVLTYLPEIIEKRRALYERYRDGLSSIRGVHLVGPLPENVEYNYAYMPLEIDEVEFGMSRDGLYEALKEYNVYSRRYFYPLVCDFSCYSEIPLTQPIPVARAVSSRIMTLPLYFDLSLESVDRICEMVAFIQCKASAIQQLQPMVVQPTAPYGCP